MTKPTPIYTEPELLQRNDITNGRWTIDECRSVRGEPQTDIVGRGMKIPTYNDELARCIRAHEMVHAKVSPATDWSKWVNRKIASEQAMTVVEELRVNTLCQIAGFNVKDVLADGGETADGERLASIKDWQGAVMQAIGTAGTLSNKLFLTGVRRHNREWGTILLDISKRAVREFKKASDLASTEVDEHSGLFPMGFCHTERLAQWVDRLADKSPEEIADQKLAQTKNMQSLIDGDSNESESKEGTHGNESDEKSKKADGNPFKGITPSSETYRAPYWGELMIERLPMPVHSKGNIGKKRVASNMGMRPRRIHRMLTDPQKRIFDRTVRGSGGVVILDASGSMSFSKEQLIAILENAPGATVAMYTDLGNNGTNCWIVADKGRMVNELPEVGAGNGVDFPAIEWGYKQKQTATTPIIWVTDGGVCGPNQPYNEILAMQCITFCKQKNIIIVPHADEAVEQLKSLKAGNKAKNIFPRMFKQTYKELTGIALT